MLSTFVPQLSPTTTTPSPKRRLRGRPHNTNNTKLVYLEKVVQKDVRLLCTMKSTHFFYKNKDICNFMSQLLHWFIERWCHRNIASQKGNLSTQKSQEIFVVSQIHSFFYKIIKLNALDSSIEIFRQNHNIGHQFLSSNSFGRLFWCDAKTLRQKVHPISFELVWSREVTDTKLVIASGKKISFSSTRFDWTKNCSLATTEFSP